jgi:hypothetical protein
MNPCLLLVIFKEETMKTLLHKTMLVAATLVLANAVSAARFAKFDGIDGSSSPEAGQEKVQQPQTKPDPQTARPINSGQPPKPSGLLLPAVQTIREAAPPKKSKSKSNVEMQWKVEEGQK